MNIQFLVALQEFVSEVNSAVNTQHEFRSEHPDLGDKADRLDSVLHAMIESENARVVAFDEHMGDKS